MFLKYYSFYCYHHIVMLLLLLALLLLFIFKEVWWVQLSGQAQLIIRCVSPLAHQIEVQ